MGRPLQKYTNVLKWKSMVGSLIQGTGMVEFEDFLMTESSLEPAGTIVVTALSPRSIHIHSLGVG